MATMEGKTSPGGETDSPSAAAAASSASMPATSPGSPMPGDTSRRDPSAGPEKWPEHAELPPRREDPTKLLASPYPTDKMPPASARSWLK